MRLLWGYPGFFCKRLFNRQNALSSSVAAVTSVLAAAASVAAPFLLVSIMPNLEEPQDVTNMVMALVGLYALMPYLEDMTSSLRKRLMEPVGADFAVQLGKNTLGKALALSMDYHVSKPDSEVAQHYINALTTTQTIPPNLSEFLAVLMEAGMGSAVLLLSNWRMGLSIPLVLFSYTAVSLLTAHRTAKADKDRSTETFTAYGDFLQTVGNYENIAYFNQGEYELARHNEMLDAFRPKLGKSMTRVTDAGMLRSTAAGPLSALSAIGITYLFKAAFIDTKEYFLFLFFMTKFMGSLPRLSRATNELRYSLIGLSEIREYLALTPSVQERPDSFDLAVERANASISFENVVFSYGEDVILNNISFSIAPGERVAVVGCSGAGKSTLVKLLFRFYDVDSGTIKINGQPIESITLSSLRRCMAVIPQNPVFMNGSILDNILYGDFNASLEQIRRALDQAGLTEFIESLPDGLDTKVGENGLKLSGGQRQRIAIVRALIKNAPILILDEATSALDPKTEFEVERNLEGVSRDHTTFIITHKMKMLSQQAVDKIIYIKNGCIAEFGTYEQLMENKRDFYQQVIQDQRAPTSDEAQVSVAGAASGGKIMTRLQQLDRDRRGHAVIIDMGFLKRTEAKRVKEKSTPKRESGDLDCGYHLLRF